MASVSGLVVTFAEDINDEAADKLAGLLRWLEGVVDVRPVEVNVDQVLAKAQVDSEWRVALVGFLREQAKAR